MEKFEINKFDYSAQTVNYVSLTIDEMVENPYGLYMPEVALVLLNDLRKKKGLKELTKDMIAPSSVRF